MLGHTPAIGINVEDYHTCTKSDFRVEPRTVVVDLIGPVEFYFVVTLLGVTVAKKTSSEAAYKWIEAHATN